MSEFIKVGSKKDFPVNRTVGVTVGDQEVCIANFDGQLSAFENSCTHAAAQLSDCDIEDGQVSCPLHGARFDVKTGDAKTLPATEPIKMHNIKVEGDDIYICLTN